MLNPDKQWIEEYLTLLAEVFGPEINGVDNDNRAELPQDTAELVRKVSESGWFCKVGEA